MFARIVTKESTNQELGTENGADVNGEALFARYIRIFNAQRAESVRNCEDYGCCFDNVMN